jgi:hypothetical protein
MAILLCRHKSQLTGRFNRFFIETVAESARHFNVRHGAIRFQQHGDLDRTLNLIAPSLVGVTWSRASQYLRSNCNASDRKHAVIIYALTCTDPCPVARADAGAVSRSRSTSCAAIHSNSSRPSLPATRPYY